MSTSTFEPFSVHTGEVKAVQVCNSHWVMCCFYEWLSSFQLTLWLSQAHRWTTSSFAFASSCFWMLPLCHVFFFQSPLFALLFCSNCKASLYFSFALLLVKRVCRFGCLCRLLCCYVYSFCLASLSLLSVFSLCYVQNKGSSEAEVRLCRAPPGQSGKQHTITSLQPLRSYLSRNWIKSLDFSCSLYY